jgi:hypothetical protein
MPRLIVGGNFEVLPGYAGRRVGGTSGLTVLTGQSGITLVKIVPGDLKPGRAKRDPVVPVDASLGGKTRAPLQ